MIRVIEVIVRDKIARVLDRDAFMVCGNSDYEVVFHFDEEWLAYTYKTARFVYKTGRYNETAVEVVFEGDRCPIPTMANSTRVDIGVYAGDLATTTPARLKMLKSIRCSGGEPVVVPEDKYNQIMAILGSINYKPTHKTDGMTQPVGVDENGQLWTLPGGSSDAELYDGLYIVTPRAADETTLETSGKLMVDDVTVKQIPYYEMDNTSGGTTIYIGADEEVTIE